MLVLENTYGLTVLVDIFSNFHFNAAFFPEICIFIQRNVKHIKDAIIVRLLYMKLVGRISELETPAL